MSAPMASRRRISIELLVMLLLLLAVLSLLLHGVFASNYTLFSNDGPLGRLLSDSHKLPDRFTGCWSDLNSIGANGGEAPTGISLGLLYLLKPIWFSKLYALLALVIVGLGAWSFFVQLRLAPAVCVLGGLAAALNSCFFSVACWGVAAQAVNAGMLFFALAALADPTAPRQWWRVILAGFVVGMGVVEGSDIGAIYSLYMVLFLLYQGWMAGGPARDRMITSLTRVAVVAVFAAFIAAQAISSLVGTSISGVVGTDQDAQTKAGRWDWATQWSLPVEESAGLLIPGLFGYRMDAPNGGSYWGRVGQDPAVTRFLENGRHGTAPRGFIRYSGGGFYAGVLVGLVGLWAGAQSLRGRASCFNPRQRQWLWFWAAVGGGSLLLAFGRFAPFYQLVYALPYFSTIRNPVKFINLVNIALLVMFAYGLDALWWMYVKPATANLATSVSVRSAAPKSGRPANSFDRFWLRGLWVAWGLALLAWLDFASQGQNLANYLASVQIKPEQAADIANFSLRQAAWFLLFLALAAGLLTAVFRGWFNGARAPWAAVAIGLFLLVDLGRANLPWVVYWNYAEKYASNPLIDRLRDRPYEHRLVFLAGQPPSGLADLNKLYRFEWLQQQFPVYNIQTLDVIEMPRVPADLAAYTKSISAIPNPTGWESTLRLWQLTGTSYVLALASAFDDVNQASRPGAEPFRVLQRFDIVPKAGVTNASPALEDLTARLDDNGPYALFEYTRALPRAKLFTHWEYQTNNTALLAALGNPDFDFGQTVLVSGPVPSAPPYMNPNQNGGTVSFASYVPKDIVLKCNAAAPAVLLLNDHYDPDWHVRVDGQPESLLRCNFIMRGVYLTPGAHTVEFKFQPPVHLMYVSLAAIGLAFIVLMVVLFPNRNSEIIKTGINPPTAESIVPSNQVEPARPLSRASPEKPAVNIKPGTQKQPVQTPRPGRRK